MGQTCFGPRIFGSKICWTQNKFNWSIHKDSNFVFDQIPNLLALLILFNCYINATTKKNNLQHSFYMSNHWKDKLSSFYLSKSIKGAVMGCILCYFKCGKICNKRFKWYCKNSVLELLTMNSIYNQNSLFTRQSHSLELQFLLSCKTHPLVSFIFESSTKFEPTLARLVWHFFLAKQSLPLLEKVEGLLRSGFIIRTVKLELAQPNPNSCSI